MVHYYTLSSAPRLTCYSGVDKYENEELIKLGWEEDVWFHVDDLSSAHVYVRLESSMTWDKLPEEMLTEVGHLVKANSISGCKMAVVTIVYTPWANLKKAPGSDIGAVTFHDYKKVRKMQIEGRRRDLTNILTKNRTDVDLASLRSARQENEKQRIREAHQKATLERKAEEARKQEAKRLKEERDYSSLMRSIPVSTNEIDEDDFM